MDPFGLDAVWEWAWARHHNVLSWYIRPLFVLPLCWFAYRRSLAGIALTLVALATSMAWFPAPDEPSPAITALLAQERVYLAGPWPVWKILITLLAPGLLILLVVAFWRRSLAWGLAVINAMALTKIAWSFAYAPGAGAYALLVPALAGLAICNAAVLLALARLRRSSTDVPSGNGTAMRRS